MSSEADDRLRDAILLDLEIVRLEIGDEVSALVEDADVDLHHLRAGRERRRLLRRRLLREQHAAEC